MRRRAKAAKELMKPVKSLTAFSFRPGEEVFDRLQFGQGIGIAADSGNIDLGC